MNIRIYTVHWYWVEYLSRLTFYCRHLQRCQCSDLVTWVVAWLVIFW